MNKPLVTCIVCTHLPENRRYLDACLKSLEAQVGVDIEVLVMASFPYPIGLPEWVRLYHCEAGMGWTHKINAGASLSDHESKFLMLLNDDVILAKHTIASMVRKSIGKLTIMNALSNCDNGWTYNANFILENEKGYKFPLDKRFYEYEDIHENWHRAIMNYRPGLDATVAVRQVCFYATLMSKGVWDAVGGLDQRFGTAGYDDEDFCLRALKIGIQPTIDFESFTFHFGGRTTSKIGVPEVTAEAKRYFEEKHGKV